MMRLGKLTVLGAALTLAVACGRGADAEFAEATPDFDGLALEITGSVDEGVDAQALPGDVASGQAGLLGEVPEYLRQARQGVRELNTALKQALAPIVALVDAGAADAQVGSVRVYGPRDHGNATFRLTIRKLAERRFGWRLEAKPLGGEDSAYVVVARGLIARGDEPHRGKGVVGIDLDQLKSVDPSVAGAGQLFAAFGHVDGRKSLSYRLVNFTPDVATREPLTAVFVGYRLMPSRATAVRLAMPYDLYTPEGSTSTAKELVLSRVRYLPGVGGRASVTASGGDIPEGKAYVGTACWDAQEQETFKAVYECTRTDPFTKDTCVLVSREGSKLACSADLSGDAFGDAPVSKDDTSPEAGAPTEASELMPPTKMPGDEG